MLSKYNLKLELVLFKSLRNCIRRNKGNFTLKSNSNKIMLCGGEGQNDLLLNYVDFNIIISFVKYLNNFLILFHTDLVRTV